MNLIFLTDPSVASYFDDVTALRVLGACGVIAGAAMFMGRGDMIGSRDFVAAAESMMKVDTLTDTCEKV